MSLFCYINNAHTPQLPFHVLTPSAMTFSILILPLCFWNTPSSSHLCAWLRPMPYTWHVSSDILLTFLVPHQKGPLLHCPIKAQPRHFGCCVLREYFLNWIHCKHLRASAKSILMQLEQIRVHGRCSLQTHLERTEKQNNKPESINWTQASWSGSKAQRNLCALIYFTNNFCAAVLYYVSVGFSTIGPATFRAENFQTLGPWLWALHLLDPGRVMHGSLHPIASDSQPVLFAVPWWHLGLALLS